MTFPIASVDLASDVLAGCISKRLRLATAESCTGGLISACLTEIAGSSKVIDRGFVVYSNQAKQDLLGVPSDLIDKFGAVSEEVAKAMAVGARSRAGVDMAVAVTGIAGPDGGTATKPVGLVHMALSDGNRLEHHSKVFSGDRQSVRQATLDDVLMMIKDAIA